MPSDREKVLVDLLLDARPYVAVHPHTAEKLLSRIDAALTPAPGAGPETQMCGLCDAIVYPGESCAHIAAEPQASGQEGPCAWCEAGYKPERGCCGRAAWHHHTQTVGAGGAIRTIPNDDCTSPPAPPAEEPKGAPRCQWCDSGVPVYLSPTGRPYHRVNRLDGNRAVAVCKLSAPPPPVEPEPAICEKPGCGRPYLDPAHQLAGGGFRHFYVLPTSSVLSVEPQGGISEGPEDVVVHFWSIIRSLECMLRMRSKRQATESDALCDPFAARLDRLLERVRTLEAEKAAIGNGCDGPGYRHGGPCRMECTAK